MVVLVAFCLKLKLNSLAKTGDCQSRIDNNLKGVYNGVVVTFVRPRMNDVGSMENYKNPLKRVNRRTPFVGFSIMFP